MVAWDIRKCCDDLAIETKKVLIDTVFILQPILFDEKN